MKRLKLIPVCLSLLCFAAALPAQSGLAGFERSDEYILEVEGVTSASGRIFWSPQARAFLLVANELPTPVLVEPSSRLVRKVPLTQVASETDGTVTVVSQAGLVSAGALTLQGDLVKMTVDGSEIVMKRKPPLLGWQHAADIAEYSEVYATRASAYSPSQPAIDSLLQKKGDLKLTVYFGSWCPFCQQKVPLVMKIAQMLEGADLALDFYGLPHDIASDPMAKRMRIRGVPTGVVFVDGKEVGRITNDGWKNPENALAQILAASG